MDQPILQMRRITRRFPGVLAVHEVDLTVRRGEIHALLGENGAGKSTLIKILGGAIDKDSGKIFVDGQSVTLQSPADALAVGIGVIYQELVLCPHLTAIENVLMGHLPRTRVGAIDWRAARTRVASLLGSLGVAIPLDVSIRRLSVAQQQLVAIAKALSRDSRILVLDEPSAVLGQRDLERLFDVMRRLQARGVAIIYISHRLEEIFTIADTCTVLKDGRFVGSWPVSTLDMASLVRAMTGRELAAALRPQAVGQSPVVLQVQGLTRRGVFEDVSLQVRAGEIVGIAGLVGSGRTEVLRAIFGADPVDRGTIHVRGKRMRFRSPEDALRHGMGLLPEDRKDQALLLKRAIRENASLASLDLFTRFGFLDLHREQQVVDGLVAELRIAVRGISQPAETLSGGNQQKVVLARWLARHCSILLFDEPTRGVDVGAKDEIYKLIRRLADGGTAVLMVSSELKELFSLCSTLLVMRSGQLVGTFSADHLQEAEVVQAMLLGGPARGTVSTIH